MIKPRAGIYTRISRDNREGSGLGVQRQEEDCRALAEREGFTVIRVYQDNDVSAHSGRRRPEYERLLKDVESGEIDVVLAWHTDRLHRRTMELERYIESCQRHGVTTQTVKAGQMDLSTPTGQMIAKTLGNIAQYESDHKGDRIRRQKLQAAKSGKYMGGRIPWGWQLRQGEVVLDEGAASAIREGIRSINAGQTLLGVTRQWNEQGIRSLSGRPYGTTQVHRILKRERNAGLVVFHGEVVADGWPAIVTIEEYRAMRDVLDRREIPRASQSKYKYLLSGLVSCHCGRRMTGTGAQATPEKPDYRRMYRCTVHSEGAKFQRGHAIREMHRLDSYVLQVIAARLDSVTVQLRDELLARKGVRSAPSDTPTANQLMDRKADLARLFAAGLIEESQLIEGTALVREQMDALSAEASNSATNEALTALLLEDSPGDAFLKRDVARQRAIIRAMADIRILEGTRPGAGFQPELVEFRWTGASNG